MKLPFVLYLIAYENTVMFLYVSVRLLLLFTVHLKTFLTYRSGYVLPIRKNRVKELSDFIKPQVDLISSN